MYTTANLKVRELVVRTDKMLVLSQSRKNVTKDRTADEKLLGEKDEALGQKSRAHISQNGRQFRTKGSGTHH